MKDVEKDFIEKICIFCLKHNRKIECMKIIVKENVAMKTYKCENFESEHKTPPKFIKFIRYTFYDDTGKYVAIIKRGTPLQFINEMKTVFDEIKYNEKREKLI